MSRESEKERSKAIADICQMMGFDRGRTRDTSSPAEMFPMGTKQWAEQTVIEVSDVLKDRGLNVTGTLGRDFVMIETRGQHEASHLLVRQEGGFVHRFIVTEEGVFLFSGDYKTTTHQNGEAFPNHVLTEYVPMPKVMVADPNVGKSWQNHYETRITNLTTQKTTTSLMTEVRTLKAAPPDCLGECYIVEIQYLLDDRTLNSSFFFRVGEGMVQTPYDDAHDDVDDWE